MYPGRDFPPVGLAVGYLSGLAVGGFAEASAARTPRPGLTPDSKGRGRTHDLPDASVGTLYPAELPGYAGL